MELALAQRLTQKVRAFAAKQPGLYRTRNRSVEILGVHFTYDIRPKQKLNVNELISSIQLKLRIWRWRDFTIMGRNLCYPYLFISHELDII